MRLSSFSYAVKFFDFRAEFVENPAASVVR